MDKKTFEIYLIRKIPYLTKGLFVLFTISAVVFVLIIELLSSKKFTPEILTFFIVTSGAGITFIKIIYASIFSTVLLMYLYIWTRYRTKGVILFNPDSFDILLKKETTAIPFSNIRRIYCNDSEKRNGEPNNRFTMTIETWKNVNIIVRIRNVSEIPKFIDKILSYSDQLKIDYITLTPVD